MGNEMGNRNVSGRQEEEKSAVETPEKSLQEDVHIDDIKGKNHVKPEAQAKDFREEVAVFSSDVPLEAIDMNVEEMQALSGDKELEDIELKPSAENSELSTESINAASQASGIQTVSPEAHLAENCLGTEAAAQEANGNTSNSTWDIVVDRHEARHNDDVKEEDCMKSEAGAKDFCAKVARLSSDYQFAAVEEKHTSSYGKEPDDTHLKPPHSSELLKESNRAATQDSETPTALSSEEANLEDNHRGTSYYEAQEQPKKGTDAEEEEAKISHSNSESIDLTALETDQHEDEVLLVYADQLLENQSVSTGFTAEISHLMEGKDKGQLTNTEILQGSSTDVILCTEEHNEGKKREGLNIRGKASDEEETLTDINSCKEKCDNLSGNEGEATDLLSINNSTYPENSPDAGLLAKLNAEKSVSLNCPLEVAPQIVLSDSLQEVGELKDECMFSKKETGLLEGESENEENKCVLNKFMTEESTASPQSDIMIIGSDCSRNEDERMDGHNLSSVMENVHQKEDIETTDENQIGFEAFNRSSFSKEQLSREVVEKLVDIGAVPTELPAPIELNPEDNQAEETENKGNDFSAMKSNENSKETTTESLVSPLLSLLKENAAMESESAVKRKQQQNYSVLFTEKAFDTSASSTSTKNVVKLEEEFPKHTRNISMFAAEAEILADLSDELPATSQTTALPIGGYARKTSSFDFDINLDPRSAESDRTPLLHHDTNANRSFSSRDSLRFQNSKMLVDYGYAQCSLQYEGVTAEEKTIRVERSDSEKSRAPFLSLSKHEEKAQGVETTENKKNNVAEKKAEKELNAASGEEVALTTSKGSGKRKPRPSIFTTCICCATAIH